MPPNPNETLAERAERIEAELMAAEQEAAEELMRKRDALRRARAQRSLEEAAQRVREEEARKAQEAREEAERRAQEEAREATRRRVLGENEANAHPEEDGDFVFEDAMDIDDGAASPSKWKKLVVEGTVLTRAPPSVVCSECASKKHKCFLPELERERATMKIGEAKEGLHVLHFSRLGPILNYLHLCLVHGESLRGQNVPEVLHPFRMKLTFVGAGEEPMLAKAAEHFSDMFAMIRRIVGVDEDVV